MRFSQYLLISKDPKSSVVRQLLRQLACTCLLLTSRFVSIVVKGKFAQPSKSLIILWTWLLAKFFVLHFMSFILHCVKSVHIRSCSVPYFPAFGLNTERFRASLRIQSKCGKRRTRITPNTNTFHACYL